MTKQAELRGLNVYLSKCILCMNFWKNLSAYYSADFLLKVLSWVLSLNCLKSYIFKCICCFCIYGDILSIITTSGHYQCVAVMLLFCIAHQRQLAKIMISINSQKQNNLASHYVVPVFPDGITWRNIYMINMEKLKIFTKKKWMLVSLVIFVMVNLVERII